MTIQQVLMVDRRVKFAGQSMTATSTNNLQFQIPTDSRGGDLIIAYVVAENLTIPSPPSGWTQLLANNTPLPDGPSSGRLLMYRKKLNDTEITETIQVSGGGNCTCVALRNVQNNFSTITEFGLDTSPASKDLSYDTSLTKPFVILLNHDGATDEPTIDITGTTETFSLSSGFRSMAIGYVLKPQSSGNVTATISSESAYGVCFTVE